MADLTTLALRTADLTDLAIAAVREAATALADLEPDHAKQAVDRARLLSHAVLVFARDTRTRAHAECAPIAVEAACARTLTMADLAVQSVETFAVATWADGMGQSPVALCEQAELAAEAVIDAVDVGTFATRAAETADECGV